MIQSRSGHSAIVTLELIFGEHRISLVQAAHNFAIAKDPVELPRGHGEIVMSVDGQIDRMPVFLPHGCGPDQKRFTIAAPSILETESAS